MAGQGQWLAAGTLIFAVLRRAMAINQQEKLNFGPNTGSVYGSFDEGESGSEIARHLLTILSMEVFSR